MKVHEIKKHGIYFENKFYICLLFYKPLEFNFSSFVCVCMSACECVHV